MLHTLSKATFRKGLLGICLLALGAGTVSSIAFGHGVGKLLAFAYVRPDHAAPGRELDVVIMGAPRKARVLDRPAYDPENLLPRTDVEKVAAK